MPVDRVAPVRWRLTLGRSLRAVGTALLLALPVLGSAQPTPGAQADDPAAIIEAAREDMTRVRATVVPGADDASLVEARRLALAVQTRAEEAASGLSSQLAEVQARLVELGTPDAGAPEPTDIAARRAELSKSDAALDAQVKLARLLSVEAEQAAAAASAQRRTQFNAELFARTRAAASAPFWQELRMEWPADLARLGRLTDEVQQRAKSIAWSSWLLAALAIAAVVAVHKPLQRLMIHLIVRYVPAGRLRRSLHATGFTLLWTLTPGLMAHALFLTLSSGPGVSDDLRTLLAGIDGIAWFGGFTAGLGWALLMPGKPSWRLPPLSDHTALTLRWFPPVLALGLVLGWVTTRLSGAANASLASTVALKTLASLTLLYLMMRALAQLRRLHREHQAEGAAPPVPLWLHALRALAGVLVVASGLGLLSGYVALGTFVANQLVWALIVASLTYLLALLIDDLFMAFLAPQPPAESGGTGGNAATAPAPRNWEQTAVIFSGAFRFALVLFALLLVLAPFGEGPLELFRRAGRVNEGLAIGEIRLLPATLLQGLLVLVIGLFVVHRFKAWLGERFMPTTRMDAGMRLSVTTMFGYVGAIAVVALAMSAVGVGLERVAWVASALSVGIGFGLQAVVQNFVSGLILLAERPVKVGDWVSLAGIEGDIRRINVRATEIQMGDRSTVIVPNSEFITKMVRNVTYTDPIGMVQIKLPMPLSTDTRQARGLLLQAFQTHPGVLETPRPNVQLDGIDGQHLVFNATGYVSSPRAAYGIKSDLLFDVLERLREAGLQLGSPPTLLLTPAQPEMPGALATPPGKTPPTPPNSN